VGRRKVVIGLACFAVVIGLNFVLYQFAHLSLSDLFLVDIGFIVLVFGLTAYFKSRGLPMWIKRIKQWQRGKTGG